MGGGAKQRRLKRQNRVPEENVRRQVSEPATAAPPQPALRKHDSYPQYAAKNRRLKSQERDLGSVLIRAVSVAERSGGGASSTECESAPRASHTPAVRSGPPLSCNFCWNTVDECGRILRRKTQYHCPECRTNLCIVPCFHEYHEPTANASCEHLDEGARAERAPGVVLSSAQTLLLVARDAIAVRRTGLVLSSISCYFRSGTENKNTVVMCVGKMLKESEERNEETPRDNNIQDHSYVFSDLERQLIIHRTLLLTHLVQDPFYRLMNISTTSRRWMLRHLAHLAHHSIHRYRISLLQFFELLGREEVLSFLRRKNAPNEMMDLWDKTHPAPPQELHVESGGQSNTRR